MPYTVLLVLPCLLYTLLYTLYIRACLFHSCVALASMHEYECMSMSQPVLPGTTLPQISPVYVPKLELKPL